MSNRRKPRAARQQRLTSLQDDHLDCDCHPAWFEFIETPTCPGCGQVPSMLAGLTGVYMPSTADHGSVATLGVGCGCGEMFEVPAVVDR